MIDKIAAVISLSGKIGLAFAVVLFLLCLAENVSLKDALVIALFLWLVFTLIFAALFALGVFL